MEYKILREWSAGSLERAVNRAIEDGWQPSGNMTVEYRNDFSVKEIFYQPMIRSTPQKE